MGAKMYRVAVQCQMSGSHGLLITEGRPEVDFLFGAGLSWREMLAGGSPSLVLDGLLHEIARKAGVYSTEELARATTSLVTAITGIDPRYRATELEGAIALMGFHKDTWLFCSVAESAHYGAFLGKPGVLVRCGHGLSAFARVDDTTCRLVAGWGGFLGDHGSGYWIGREALIATTRYLDSVADHAEEVFAWALAKAVGHAKPMDILEEVDAQRAIIGEFGAARFITRLGHAVVKLSATGDAFARLIATRAQSAIVDAVHASVHGMLKPGMRIPLCLRGGVVEDEPEFAAELARRIWAETKTVCLPKDGRNGAYSPIVGAGLLALGLQTAEAIEHQGYDFLLAAGEHDVARPRLAVVPI